MRSPTKWILLIAALGMVVVFLAGLPEDRYDDVELDRGAGAPAEEEGLLAAEVEAEAPAAELIGRGEAPDLDAEALPVVGAVPTPKVPEHWAQGQVLDPDGEPVPGAEVYHLAPSTGERLTMHARTSANAEGRFRLPVDRWGGTTFGARVRGRGAVFVAANDVAPGDFLRLQLPRPVELNVLVVRPDGSGVEGVSVTAAPLQTRRPGVFFETPLTPEQEQMGVTDEHGAVVFRFTRPDHVRVTPQIVDATFEPTSIQLERPGGHVTFEMQEGCRLVLKVIDTQTGRYLEQAVHVVIYNVETWAQVDGFRTDDSPDVIDETLALEPGRYAIELTAVHREPAMIGDILVERAGQTIEREVQMPPRRESGHLVVKLPPTRMPPAETLKGHHALYPTVLLHRRDGGHGVRGYQPTGFHYVPLERAFRTELRPGSYDGFLLLPVTNEVAALTGVLVVEGEETEYQVSPRRGTTVSLAELVPEGTQLIAARVELPSGVRFPIIGQGLGTTFVSAEALLHVLANLAQLPEAKRDEVILGPFPPGGATVIVTDTESSTHTARAH